MRTTRILSLALAASALFIAASCKRKSDDAATPANFVTVDGQTSSLDNLGSSYNSTYTINNLSLASGNDAGCEVYFNERQGLPATGAHPVSDNLDNGGDSVYVQVSSASGTGYSSLRGGTVSVGRSGDAVTASFSGLTFRDNYSGSARVKASAHVSSK